jgi:hypothetical protein
MRRLRPPRGCRAIGKKYIYPLYTFFMLMNRSFTTVRIFTAVLEPIIVETVLQILITYVIFTYTYKLLVGNPKYPKVNVVVDLRVILKRIFKIKYGRV